MPPDPNYNRSPDGGERARRDRPEDRALVTRTLVRWTLLVTFAVVLLWLSYEGRKILLLGVAGMVGAVVLGGSARRLARHLPWPSSEKKRYLASLWMISIGLLGLVAASAYFLGPRIASDLRGLESELPDAIAAIKDFAPVEAYMGNGDSLSESQRSQLTGTLSSAAGSLLSGTIYTLSSLILVVFIAIFAAAQPQLYLDALSSCFPPDKRADCRATLKVCVRALWSWLKGQGLAMLIIGTFSATGLWLLDVRYAITLGIIAGIFQFVPYVGPIASAVPALLVALTMSPQTVLWVALLYLAIQFLEGNFITPMVMQEEADLPPLATLLSTVFFGAAFGILGAIVATPLAVLLMTLKREIYEKRILHAP